MTNWPAYEAGLRARGSLTVWFTAEAIEVWRAEPRTTRGGQPRYSALGHRQVGDLWPERVRCAKLVG